jgi:hypothetical protein
MRNSVKEELEQHLVESVICGVLTPENREDWLYLAFNQSYYIVGYYECSQWLKKHNIDTFEAIDICNQYELDVFGSITSNYNDSEKVVNMLTYIYGEEVLSNYESELLSLVE